MTRRCIVPDVSHPSPQGGCAGRCRFGGRTGPEHGRVGGRAHDGAMSEHRIVMLGPPGSGKGTQARRLAERVGVVHVSVGALLRDEISAGSELGHRIAEQVESGDLVDDATVVDVVTQRLAEHPDGWILDGAPRTLAQAELLAPTLEGDGRPPATVVCLDVPIDEIRDRLTSRAEREDRADDTPEVIEHRIATWAEESPPLLRRYEERSMLVTVDGTGSIDDIAERVTAVTT